MERVPLYSYDGRLVQCVPLARLRRLDQQGRLLSVVRKRKGEIVRAILARLPGEPSPVKSSQYLGTKYCVKQKLNDGHRCFRLRALGDRPTEEVELAPEVVRPIFTRVLVDCLMTNAAA